MKRDLVVVSTRHHRARLLKYYPKRPCAPDPSFVISRMLRPLQTHFLLFQQIFFVLVCIHPETHPGAPSGSGLWAKTLGDNYLRTFGASLQLYSTVFSDSLHLSCLENYSFRVRVLSYDLFYELYIIRARIELDVCLVRTRCHLRIDFYGGLSGSTFLHTTTTSYNGPP